MPATLVTAAPAAADHAAGDNDFQRYYAEAGPDYAAWSPRFNMHFGYYRRGMNPFAREAMLEEMNRQVLLRLNVETQSPRILDMGCGLGATLRSIATNLPGARLHGITLVPWQVEQGRLLNARDNAAGNIELALGDYQNTGYPSASFDAVYAIESSCYAAGAKKSALLQEARRLLRPGGRIVVADGFLGPGKLRGPQAGIFRRLCDCWAIETFGQIGDFTTELARLGFDNIHVQRLQLRVTPSVLHVPWVTLRFLLTSAIRSTRKMTRARWNNVIAPLLMPFVSFPVGPVAYYLVSAARSRDA
ncbi:methyltransferase domain-containing protein [Acidobacteria bacterium AB60]|nr:methyltransferase domain-containing protein [Acidobacteria bacterium AB60]